MNPMVLRNHALIVSQAACVTAKVAAMQAENAVRAAAGKPPAFAPDAFEDLIRDHGIGWNDVIGTDWS